LGGRPIRQHCEGVVLPTEIDQLDKDRQVKPGGAGSKLDLGSSILVRHYWRGMPPDKYDLLRSSPLSASMTSGPLDNPMNAPRGRRLPRLAQGEDMIGDIEYPLSTPLRKFGSEFLMTVV
jgi:hypothetical protein